MIRRLSEQVVNRIAAGEVIERPAAAVKELVENAIDAGARRIEVSLEGGGIERIVVRDDGVGMTPAALVLALQRHCTSKLLDETLVRIATLGFRGEALPSIGAAARLCLTSRPPGAAEAWQLRVEGGVTGEPVPCAGGFGTSAVVEDLFFATPARRKFLKSARIEAGHAETVLRRLALAAPWISFRVEIDGRVALELPAADRAARTAALLAEPALLAVAGERFGMVLEGLACGPALHRATASGQFLVVNGRPVCDPVLRTAVRVAYRHLIVAGRHPVLALFLTIPPERLDVNVHPAKTELRFADAEAVRGLVIGSLGRALSGGAGAGGSRAGAVWSPRAARIWYPGEPPPIAASGFAEAPPASPAPVAAAPGRDGTLALAAAPQARHLEDVPPLRHPGADEVRSHPLGAAVAQVLDTYVIAVAEDGSLVLVDQHAAHERLTHEALREQVLGGAVASQRLLLPEVVALPTSQGALLLSHAAGLARLGLEIEAFGVGAVLVRALPALLGGADAASLVRDLADELADDELGLPDQATVLTARLEAVIARMACHGSIRAGRRLQRAEMDALLRRMEATPRAATCSHGRPTYLRLSRHEIERLFGRG